MKLEALKITWPTAAVIIAFIIVWAVVLYLKLPVPSWMMVAGVALGKYIVAIVEGAAASGGSPQVSALPTKQPPTDGPVPPMAA